MIQPPKKRDVAQSLAAAYGENPDELTADVMNLAKYIITKCTIDDKPVNHDDLQIMLFYLQKEALRLIGFPLHDGVFQAWEQGPVIVKIHDHYAAMGYLRHLHSNIEEIKGRTFVDMILDEAEHMTIMGFHHASTKADGAWHEIWSHHREEHMEIPLELIQKQG